MSGDLALLDEQDVADLGTFLSRARRLNVTSVRLQGRGRVLGVSVCTRPGHGLMGEGTVIGLRAFGLAEDASEDVLVAVDAVQDRLARLRSAGESGTQRLAVPPVPVVEPWVGLSPPLGGWEPVGTLPGATLTRVATEGIAEVAAAPTSAVRESVWARTVPGTSLPAASALAAHALGFVTDEATLFRQGRWQRLSTSAGHVLAR